MDINTLDLPEDTRKELIAFEKSCGFSKDPVLNILRVHLLLEHYLERILATQIPRIDRLLENAGLTFHQKLVLVDSFDILGDHAIQSMRKLNKVRNQLAHEKDKSVSRKDIDLIGRPHGKQFTMITRMTDNKEILLLYLLAILCGQLSGAVDHLEKESIADEQVSLDECAQKIPDKTSQPFASVDSGQKPARID